MDKLTSRAKINQLCLLLSATYMISYITRTNFGTIVSEISHATGLTKSMLSIPLTGSFITYGVGQLLSGILGDRVSPKRLVSMGLTVTVVMNLLIPLCTDVWMMAVIWCVNGLAQAFMWPPIVRIMTTFLNAEDYKRAATKVSSAGLVGTIFVYLVAPVIILITGWRGTFYFAATAGMIMLFVWNRVAPDIKNNEKNEHTHQQSAGLRLVLSPLVLLILVAIVLQGMLRDGITTWMPSFVAESFQLGQEISILTGVLLPVFSIFCINFANWLYQKKVKNPLACSGLLFGIGAVFAALLYFSSQGNAVISVLLSALLIGCINGVNLLLISMVPPYFQKFGNVSAMSGILNSCTYIGSALSTYGFAVLSEGIGWHGTILCWVSIAVIGCVLCWICTRPWKRKFGV